jgi:hypothetical protein
MENLYSALEQQYDLPPGSLTAVRSVESKGNTKAVSPKGALGDFQFMPDTAKAYGVDPTDPVSSATGAAKYLADLTKQYGSFQAALAHYNGGVKSGQAVASGKEAPYQETRSYLTNVNNNMRIDPSQIKFDGEINPANITLDASSIDPSQVVVDQPTANAVSGPSVGSNLQEGEQPSSLAQFARGVGKSFVDTGMGAKQLLDLPAQFLEKKFKNSAIAKFGAEMGMPTAEQSAAQTEKDIANERAASANLMQSTPGQIGYGAGALGQTLLGGAALKGAGTALNLARPAAMGEALINPATYGSAAAVGATQGALQPTLPDENKAFNIGAGALLGTAGLGIVNALGRVAQPIQSQLNEIGTNAVKTLREAGVPLDLAQSTGSKLLERVKAALSDNPITAGAQQEASGLQKQAFNQAIAKTMGESATNITPDIIQQAKTRLGNIYDDIASRNQIHYDDVLQKHLNDIRSEAEQVLNPTQFSTIEKQISNIVNKAESQGGGLHGEQYQAIKKVLDKLSKGSDTDVAAYARELKESLLDGLTRTAKEIGNDADVALLKKTNQQYGNMKKIEDVVLKDPEGNVSPSLLMNSLAAKGKRYSFYQDDPQLAKLASAGKVILPEKLPNSGTTARILAGATLPALGGIGYGLYQGDLEGAAKGVAAGVVAPKIGQAVINNPALGRYLSQGIKNVPLRSLLELPREAGASKIPTAAAAAYLQSLQQKNKLSDIPRLEMSGMAPQFK